MTRYTEIVGSTKIAYGWDRACGVFVQVFDLDDPDGDENPVVDVDTLFDGLTLGEAIFTAKAHGARKVARRLTTAPGKVKLGILEPDDDDEDES